MCKINAYFQCNQSNLLCDSGDKPGGSRFLLKGYEWRKNGPIFTHFSVKCSYTFNSILN